jgi:hypothetical protein
MAIAQAKELDAYYDTHKKPVGPLHGLPISLKDQLRVKVRSLWFHLHDQNSQNYANRALKHPWVMSPGWVNMTRPSLFS